MLNNIKISSQLNEFQYGRSTIEYLLILENRNTLAITVKPDKSVLVKAPFNSEIDKIHEKVLKRGQWILKQINYFDKYHPLQPEREYISGETHYYIGRQYRLRIRKDKQEEVKLKGKFFIAKTLKPNNSEHIKNLMMYWYTIHAQVFIDQRIKIYAKEILGEDHKGIKTRYVYLKKRWGSCDSEKGITFNIELVKTPIQCIDYVIVHEVCHVIHPNHDKEFYRTMGKIMPDWQKRKDQLELFGLK